MPDGLKICQTSRLQGNVKLQEIIYSNAVVTLRAELLKEKFKQVHLLARQWNHSFIPTNNRAGYSRFVAFHRSLLRVTTL